MIFQNTFNIQGAVGGGGIDMRRTVTMLADQLEDGDEAPHGEDATDGLRRYRPSALTLQVRSADAQAVQRSLTCPGPGSPASTARCWSSSSPTSGTTSRGATVAGRNPPFTQGAAGRLLPALEEGGIPSASCVASSGAAEYDPADAKSTARLYFMYNPEKITRDYVSYLDQGALDPFNTVFQSGNLVPPPSFMDFTFSPAVRPPGGGAGPRPPRRLRGLRVLRPRRPQRGAQLSTRTGTTAADAARQRRDDGQPP